MPVPNQTPYIVYNANGLTTVFPFEFYIISASDIQVSLNGVIVNTGYSVSGVGNVGGGDVTFLTPPANGIDVMLERVVPTYRLTDYQDNGDLLADTVNKDFDRLWMAIQRYGIHLGLALRRPLFGGPFDAQGYRISELGSPVDDHDAATKEYVDSVSLVRTLRVPERFVSELPPANQRANQILAFNSEGQPITVPPESGSASDVLIELAKPTGAGLVGAYDENGNSSTVQNELGRIRDNFSQTPVDFFIGSFFNSNTDVSLTLFKSYDGLNFSLMNKFPLLSPSGTPAGNRDPSIVFHKGSWYISVTGANANSDFVIWKSQDLISWTQYLCKAGDGLWGKPGYTIGGTIPTISPIWAPSLFVDNDELYCQISVAYKPQAVDVDGNLVNWMVPFSCRCNNLENLTFDSAVQMLSDTSVQRIDVEVTRIPSGYALVIKNEYNKHIEIWTSDTYIGGYSRVADLDFGGVYVEGPCLVWLNHTKKWRLYADAFRQNGVTWSTDSSDLITWSAPVRVQSPGPMRHGTVYNISNSPEAPAAVASFVKASSMMASDHIAPKWSEGGTLVAGSQTIVPQCNYVYRVGGSTQATLNISEKGGDYFWLLVASGLPAAGITVAGTKVDGAFTVGYGQTNLRLFKMVWNTASLQYQLDGNPNQNGDTALLNGQTGWPTISTTFIPVHNRTYTTNGAVSATTITGLPSNMPDGTQFHLWIGSESNGGSIVINANAANVEIGSSNITLSGATGHGNKLFTMKKVGGVWRLLAF